MDITLNGQRRATEASTVAGLVAELGLAGKRVAVERNGEIVPRSRHDQTPLREGDRLEIVGAVGGG
jgi:sulfur carrier protein